MSKPKTIKIDDIEYVQRGVVEEPSKLLNGLPYVIVRTQSAGVFAGYQKSRNGQEVVLLQARRLWMWTGAASLSQLATDGTSSPSTCKFPCEVSSIELLQSIEILQVTEKAKNSIASVSVWKQ